mgnify:CR=1 FL=1
MIEYLKLVRPANGIMTAIAVYIGAVVAGGSLTTSVILGMVSAFLISAGGMAINDYHDVEADKVNKKKKRPVAKGAIKKEYALIAAVVLSLIGLAAAYFISTVAFYIALFAAIVLFAYSMALKKIVLVGNIAVSFLVALSFVYGALIVGSPSAVTFLALLAFLANMGREIYKDIEDVLGDQKIGRKTLALHIGVLKAKYVASIFTLAAVALSFVPFFLTLDYVYLFFVVIADIIFIAAILSPLALRAKLSKVAMAVALVAFYAAAIQ